MGMASMGDPRDPRGTGTDERCCSPTSGRRPGAGGVSTVSRSPPGYLTEDELAQRYADRTGRDLGHLGFYEAWPASSSPSSSWASTTA